MMPRRPTSILGTVLTQHYAPLMLESPFDVEDRQGRGVAVDGG